MVIVVVVELVGGPDTVAGLVKGRDWRCGLLQIPEGKRVCWVRMGLSIGSSLSKGARMGLRKRRAGRRTPSLVMKC